VWRWREIAKKGFKRLKKEKEKQQIWSSSGAPRATPNNNTYATFALSPTYVPGQTLSGGCPRRRSRPSSAAYRPPSLPADESRASCQAAASLTRLPASASLPRRNKMNQLHILPCLARRLTFPPSPHSRFLLRCAADIRRLREGVPGVHRLHLPKHRLAALARWRCAHNAPQPSTGTFGLATFSLLFHALPSRPSRAHPRTLFPFLCVRWRTKAAAVSLSRSRAHLAHADSSGTSALTLGFSTAAHTDRDRIVSSFSPPDTTHPRRCRRRRQERQARGGGV